MGPGLCLINVGDATGQMCPGGNVQKEKQPLWWCFRDQSLSPQG